MHTPYIISGGTGFIGTQLCKLLLQHGHPVYVLTTRKGKSPVQTPVQTVYWDPSRNYIDPSFFVADCKIINLAGTAVAGKRWTASRKQEIVDSRVNSINTLADAIHKKQIRPLHIVSASAIGFYGDGKKIFTEEDHGDNGFLSETCKIWENAASKFSTLNIPLSIVRIGIVLGKEGGALKEFLNPLRLGLAAIPGNGKQNYSWIHIQDVCRLIYFLSSANKEGIYNAAAPFPVSIDEIFEQVIQNIKPIFGRIHIPSWLIKMILGEMANEVLKSTTVTSKKIQEHGFVFEYEDIGTAIGNLLKTNTGLMNK